MQLFFIQFALKLKSISSSTVPYLVSHPNHIRYFQSKVGRASFTRIFVDWYAPLTHEHVEIENVTTFVRDTKQYYL